MITTTTRLFKLRVASSFVLLFLLSLVCGTANGQNTRLVNTTTPATVWGGITFRLTTGAREIRVDTVFVASDATAATFEVWYKPTGLNSQPAPGDFSGSNPLWFNVIAGQSVSSGQSTLALVIPGGLVVPANSQYGIYIGNTALANTGLKYASTVPNPDSVYNSDVSIKSGTNTGYGWVRNAATANHPRSFCGGISYGFPTYGPNNASIAGLVTPVAPFCPGNKDISVRLKNTGTNVLSTVTIKWKLDNVLQTPISWTAPLDTVGGPLYPSDTVVTLATGVAFNSTRTIEAWTEMPNGVADTTNADDSIRVTLTPAISGTFTIGGTSPDFATIEDAVSMLTSAGVCGPVHFDVRAGTYTGQISLSNISGSSATNTITFQGADKSTTIVTNTYTAGEYATWATTNVSYLTLRDLTINATHSTTGWGIRLNGAHHCKIINCNVNVPAVSSSAAMGIVVSGSPTSYSTAGRADNLEIDSVSVTGGYISISSYGASAAGINVGLKLTNCNLTDYYYAGIYQYYSASVDISYNRVTHLNSPAATYGMYLSQLTNSGGVANKVRNNYLNVVSSYGIYFTTATNPATTNKGLVANNILTGTLATYGMYMSAGTNWRIAHNSIYFKTNTATLTYVPAYITGGSAITCVNNVFRTLSTGYTFYGSAATIFDTLDYNVYSKDVKGANYLYLAGAYTDVTLIGAGSRNTNAKTFDPDFAADSTLMPLRSCMAGTAVPSVPTDFNGASRSATAPTIGAYEIAQVSLDARAEVLRQPVDLSVVGAQDAAVRIRNEGTTTLTSLDVTVRVNNRTPITVSWTGSLAQCDTTTIVFTGGNQVTFDSVSRVVAYTSNPNGGTDLKKTNDTISVLMYAPFAGSYTVGGSGAQFADVAEAVSALKAVGVVGPVTFNINPGTYQGQIRLNGVTGISASNTVTFQGVNKATTIVTHAYTVGDYATWTIDNLSYVTLRNLTINATHATNAWGVRLHNAHNCKIINCDVNVTPYSGSTAMGIVVAGSATSYTTAGRADNLEIDSVAVTGGYMSFCSYGASAGQNVGLKLTNSSFTDYYYVGLYQYYSTSINVSGNTITHLGSTNATYGMYLSSLGNTGGVPNIFTNNQVNSKSSYGMYFTTATNPSNTNRGLLANNVIYGGSTIYGLYMTACTNWRIAHNTSLFSNSNTTVTYVPAFITGGSGITCVNNIFRTLKTTGYTFYGSATTIFDTLNYNVYSKEAKGASYLYLGAAYTDVSFAGVGSHNTNSSTLNPAFTDEDGILIPLSANIDNTATPVPSVPTDITGAARSATTPDPGAYEFTGLAGDIALTDAVVERAGDCYNSNDTLFVTVKNQLGSTVNFSVNPLTIRWSSTGPVNSSDSIVINTGTLAVDSVQTVYTTSVNMSVPGNYSLFVYIDSNSVNRSTATDTLSAPILTEVKPLLSLAQYNFTVNAPTDTVVLEARSPIFPAGGVFFTEVSHYKYTVGAPSGGWPAYLLSDDYVEITGVPNSDLAGYKMEEWSASAVTHSVTFPTGTVFSPNGTMIIATGQLGSSTPSPSNFYYHSGNTYSHGSGDNSGYILKDPSGIIVDAVGYGSAFAFPASSGVTASDWSGATPAGTTTSGNKLNGPDNNSASNWVNSGTVAQDPNALNANVPLPSPNALTGLTWYHNGVTIAADTVKVTVGPWSTPGIYTYVAKFTNACGTFYDTAFVTASSSVPVQLTTFSAARSGSDVNLVWNTASEINNSHFEIEKSVNGRNFSFISRVGGHGTTSRPNAYDFKDENAANSSARALYYRLKQFDFDGSYSYSRIAVVTLGDNRISALSAYPNPSNGAFTISADLPSTSDVNIRLVNIMGATVWNQTRKAVAGSNTFDAQLQLPEGIYLLVLEQDGITSTRKIVFKR
jgi:hypothetical protein